jgi:hypothetical protein
MAAKLRQLFLPEHWAATGLSLGSVLPALLRNLYRTNEVTTVFGRIPSS